MYTLGDLVKTLGRSAVYLRGLQDRFDLPIFENGGYTKAYRAFLRTVIHLRTLGVPEDVLLKLWHLEKKLMLLLHADATGSPTWFLDACGQTRHLQRRLLLTNYDVGTPLHTRKLQLSMNFREASPELFAGHEMGEDALRVLERYLQAYQRIRADAVDEARHLRSAAAWAGRILKNNGHPPPGDAGG